ncbi:MAG: PAS-domain containing protein, partial [Candidatus Eisenbacteria bacterium]|nr:PAS-domain containing protein [Candidatus Eisenbacteria bacterium]
MTRIPFAGLFAGGSLRGRLLAPIVATSVFVSAAGIALVLETMRTNYEARMRQECALLLAAVANSVQAAPSPEDLQRFVSAMGAERDVETLLIAAGTPARVIACSKRAWVGQLVSALPDRGDVRADVERVSGSGSEMAPHWESSGVFDMTRAIWIPAAGDRSGKLVPGIIMVHVRSAETEAAMFHQALDFSLVVLALIVALALIVRALIERRVLTPLAAVLRFVREREAGGAAGARATWTPDEIGALGATLGRLLEKVDEQTGEIVRARGQLFDAIEALDAGVAMYDCTGALVLFNRKYTEQWSSLHGLIVPGIRSADLAKAYAKGQHVLDTADNPSAHPPAGDFFAALSPFDARVHGRWLRIVPNRTRDGGTVILQQDITATRRIQDSLQQAEARARGLLDVIPDMLFLIDANDRFSDFRTPDVGLLFKPPHEFLGRLVAEVLPPELAALIIDG